MSTECTPRQLFGLGAATRPSWCPPINESVDPCEMRYSVDIPIIGRTDVGVPINRMVNDAMQSATQQLPAYLPIFMQQVQPYIDSTVAAIEADAVKTIEYEVNYLTRELMTKQVDPRVTALVDEVTAEANALKDEVLKTLMILGATILLGVGVSAWWINREREADIRKR